MNKRSRICLDVSGHLFKINKEVLTNGPESGLSRLLVSDAVSELSVLEIDRPVETFSAILAWYQTGELHIPATSCPRAFLNELEFWEISPEVLTSCCNNRLQAFLSEQDTLFSFGRSTSEDYINSCRCFESIRSKIWQIVDYTRPSIPGKIYFITTLIMILLSIITLACSTDQRFQRAITNCERLEYMESANMEDYDLVKKKLEQFCDDFEIPGASDDPFTPMHMLTAPLKDIPEPVLEEDGDFIHVYFPIENNNATSISSSGSGSDNQTTAFVPSPMAIFRNNVSPPQFLPPIATQKSVKIPNMKVPVFILLVFEAITIIYFTIDILLRLFSCPHIGRYFLSIINVTDAAAIIFTYAHAIWSFVHIHEQYTNNMMDLLKIFQMLRSFRLFRIVSNVKAGRVLAYTLRANLNDLFVLLLFLVSGVCVFSSCLYIVDRGKSVASIPEGWYWAVVTMTTVGYGDIVPKTPLGQFVTCICMIFGVLLFAVTLPIFANNFLTLYQYADVERYMKSVKRKKAPSSIEMPVDKEDSVVHVDPSKV